MTSDAPGLASRAGPYPVVAEVGLPPVPRERFVRPRRDLRDLPRLLPGTMYVFRTGGAFVEYGERHVDAADRMVVEATGVCLVQLRPQRIVADIPIESRDPAARFVVRAGFRCKVLRPADVAEAALIDLDLLLAAHLAEHDRLGSLGLRFDIAQAHEVRRLADALIRAYCMVAPPEVAGIDVDLATVEMATVEMATAETLVAAEPRAVDDAVRGRHTGLLAPNGR